MTELSGITVTPGIMPAALRESLQKTVEKIGAKLIDQVRIDTTHFVCTEGRGQQWEKALEMNVPVVVPDWVKGCEREGRIVGVRGYYLNADPRLRQVGPSQQQQQQQSPQPGPQSPPARQPSPRTQITPPTPERLSASATSTEVRDEESEDEEGRDEAAPSPPPKSPKFDRSPINEPGEQKFATEEPKARKEDVKPAAAQKDDTDEEEEDESDDGSERGENGKAVQSSLPSHVKQGTGTSTPNSQDMEEIPL